MTFTNIRVDGHTFSRHVAFSDSPNHFIIAVMCESPVMGILLQKSS